MDQPIGNVNGTMSALDGHKLPTIWEAGHYYHAKGPTRWSEIGWRLMAELSHESHARMLFIDDVHPLADVHDRERALVRAEFTPKPSPTHILSESSVLRYSYEALDALRRLPKRQRARKIGDAWHCSGFPLESEGGRPLCLFFDLGLTWHKQQLGFARAINVVPEFYEDEQRRLLRLAKKAAPSLELRVILHDEQGAWRYLES